MNTPSTTETGPASVRTHHVIFSGGLDSTSLLAKVVDIAAQRGEHVQAVSFDYGQRHRVELEHAAQVAEALGVPHLVLDLSGLMQGSALIDPEVDVPLGHYAAPTMALTVVHGRNMLFASTTVAQAQPGDAIYTGVHNGDHPIYADCRPEFWGPFAQAVEAAYGVEVLTPFIDGDKAEAVTVGVEHGAPLELSWSCYNGGLTHCGACGTCVERREAFELAGVTDPTVYQATDPVPAS